MRFIAFALLVCGMGCGHHTEQFVTPDQVSDFTALYEANCAGCHGPNGRLGAAGPLNDPVYLAWIGKDKLKDVIARGVPRTAMPAFAQKSGGVLTDKQVDILAEQMVVRWSHPQTTTVELPPYSSELGEPKRGEEVFHKSCAPCHEGKGVGGSVIDPSFLALVSDQSLRTTVVAGRTDRGMPNWGKLSPQEVSDVVAWVSSHRATSDLRSQSTND